MDLDVGKKLYVEVTVIAPPEFEDETPTPGTWLEIKSFLPNNRVDPVTVQRTALDLGETFTGEMSPAEIIGDNIIWSIKEGRYGLS
jgi:hypothetical protein